MRMVVMKIMIILNKRTLSALHVCTTNILIFMFVVDFSLNLNPAVENTTQYKYRENRIITHQILLLIGYNSVYHKLY